MKTKIAQEAERLYNTYGIKSLSMSDIAQMSGTSVKVVNKYFPNKEALLKECVQNKILQEEIFNPTDCSLLDLLVDYAASYPKTYQKINRRSCSDIRKYYPSVYLFLTDALNRHARTCQNKVNDGIRQGHIQEDVHPEMVYAFMQEQDLKLLFDETLPRNWDEMLIPDIIMAFARGIATPEGQSYIDNKLKIEKQHEIH